MDSGENRKYDYLITDANGTRKVINGVEYPGTEDDLPKKHQDSGCAECRFVQDRITLLLYVIPRELREGATERPRFIGKFHMPDWVGHSGFYLFKCKNCENVSVDYPHGYTGFGLIYLSCNMCDENLLLEAFEEKAIYEREGVPAPSITREEREKEFMEMAGKLEKETGKRIMIIKQKKGWREFFSRFFN